MLKWLCRYCYRMKIKECPYGSNRYRFFLILLTVLIKICKGGSDWSTISICTSSLQLNPNETDFHLNCFHPGDRIVIGWSYYGVRGSNPPQTNTKHSCNPLSNDCIMEHTEKVAELCTGLEKCLISNQPQFVHKCSRYSNYLHIAYKCIPAESTEHICSSANLIADDVFLTSSNFPDEYHKNSKCVCDISTNKDSSLIIESHSFNTQEDNDIASIEGVNIEKHSFSGTLPVGTVLLHSGNYARVNFESDKDVSTSGFLLGIKALKKCPSEYIGVGLLCVRRLQSLYNWFDAKEQCESANDKLLRLPDDRDQARQLSNWIKDSDISEFWLDTDSKIRNYIPSNWLLPSSSITVKPGKCVTHGSDRNFIISCQRNSTAICFRNREEKQYPVTMQCNLNMKHLSETKSSFRVNELTTRGHLKRIASIEQRRLSQIQGCLFWLLCVCIVLVSLNLIICLTCYRRTIMWSLTTDPENPKWNMTKDFSLLNATGTTNATCTCCLHAQDQQRLRVNLLLASDSHVYESIAAKQKTWNTLMYEDKTDDELCCCHAKHKDLSGHSAESGYSSTNRP